MNPNLQAQVCHHLLAVRLFAPLVACTLAWAQAPTLSSIAPNHGLEIGGTLVTIQGTNLDTVTAVTIGGAALSNMQIVDSTTVIGNAPAASSSLVDVTATNPAGSDSLPFSYAYEVCVPSAGSAVAFDGANDMVTFGSAAAFTQHTIEAWVRIQPTAKWLGMAVGQIAGPSSWCGHGTLLGSQDSGVCSDVDSAGCGTGSYLWSPAVNGSWTHLAATYDGTLQRFYVNGQQVGLASPVTMQPSTWLMAGAIQWPNGYDFYYSGELDEIRIWSTVRMVQEINDTMHRRLVGNESGLVGYWRCDEGAGQHVAPTSASGPTGVFGTSAAVQSSDPTWIVSGAPICDVVPATPSVYCSAKVNSQGCTPAIGWSGTPSMSSTSPFTISAGSVLNNKNGLCFYGYQPDALPFEGGTLCIAAPLKRTTLQNAGGNPPPNDCSGSYSLDFNAFAQGSSDPNLIVGATLFAQYWTRDPLSAGNVGLTDALRFELGP